MLRLAPSQLYPSKRDTPCASTEANSLLLVVCCTCLSHTITGCVQRGLQNCNSHPPKEHVLTPGIRNFTL
eukprot:1161235-Pelagomonas_calceolata.AAC.8